MYKPHNPDRSPQSLAQAVLQITEMLAMYQAELASVLQLECKDIGNLGRNTSLLLPGTDAWKQALLFVRFYELLFERLNGDGVAMCNWLRRKHRDLSETPLIMLVDKGRLVELIKYLEEAY